MLTSQQLQNYHDQGYVVLPNAFEWRLADAAADEIWEHLSQHRGVRRNQPETWAIEGPWLGLKTLRRRPAFEALHSSMLETSIDCLLGASRWRRLDHWGGFLISFPDRPHHDWTLPTRNWHVDFQLTHPPGEAFGVQSFVYLSNVVPRGGGTLVIAGSHKLTERFVNGLSEEDRGKKYGDLRDQFHRTDPWLQILNEGQPCSEEQIDNYMQHQHEIDGVRVRVEELTAGAGDAILVHPWLVHVTAPNAARQPRFVLHRNVYAEDSSS